MKVCIEYIQLRNLTALWDTNCDPYSKNNAPPHHLDTWQRHCLNGRQICNIVNIFTWGKNKKMTSNIPVSNLLLAHSAGLLFCNDALHLLMKDSLFLDLKKKTKKHRGRENSIRVYQLQS